MGTRQLIKRLTVLINHDKQFNKHLHVNTSATIQNIIDQLALQPHPEGGYFKETYRSKGVIQADGLDPVYQGSRNYSTCIYFLLTADTFSAFHRIKQDEFWHFYDGSPIELHLISPEGEYSKVIIGRDVLQGQVPQFVVTGGYWFAANVLQGGDYALTGCTVAPGFDFADFELPERQKLLNLFPQHAQVIIALTKG